jgi:DNA polymerase-3 subunit alpha
MDILIKINFFEEFGNNKKLLDVYNEFYKGKSKYSIKIKEGSKEKRIKDLREIEKNTKNSSMGILDQIAFEYENLGYVQTTYDQIDKRFTFVLDINEDYSPRANLYCLKTGRTKDIKIQKLIKKKNQFNKFDILYCKKFTKREAVKFIDNKYVKIENEFQFWLEDYDVISPEQFDKTILNI